MQDKAYSREDVEVLDVDLSGYHGTAWLIRVGGKHYAVSAVEVPLGLGVETYVFETDEKGKVTSWGEIAGVKKWDHEAAIADLLDILKPEIVYAATQYKVLPQGALKVLRKTDHVSDMGCNCLLVEAQDGHQEWVQGSDVTSNSPAGAVAL